MFSNEEERDEVYKWKVLLKGSLKGSDEWDEGETFSNVLEMLTQSVETVLRDERNDRTVAQLLSFCVENCKRLQERKDKNAEGAKK